MIELLILFVLTKKVLTMYGISKTIKSYFSVLTIPSYGTIKPALNRLEKAGCLKVQKAMSKGGRPSTFYSISDKGESELQQLLLSVLPENPVQFLTVARIRLYCAEALEPQKQKEMFLLLKNKAESLVIDSKILLKQNENEFYPKMVLDNLICEYTNLISLLEGFERACNN